MANIDDFKANLIGGGARPNQFRVTITPPSGIAIGLDVRRTSFLCTASTIPEVSIAEIAVAFRGRKIYMAGDRDFPNAWETTFYNDTDFMIRNALERWNNGMNNMTDNEGLTNPADYQVDAFVDHLDRNGATIKSYTLRGVFPTVIGVTELSYAQADEIETFTVTLGYQFFESNTTT